MEFRLIREPSRAGATLGVLFCDGHYFSFTLEDEVREQPGQPVAAWKVPGQTAIPAGRYELRPTWSPRFGRVLPEVLAVPGFSGIRIHRGNRATDTEGCILVGFQRANAAVLTSTAAETEILRRLDEAARRAHRAWLTVENPLSIPS